MELFNKKPNVLCILDEFSFNCFKPECDVLIPLHPAQWKEQIEDFSIDFFLCESAWKPVNTIFNIGSGSPIEKKKLYYQLKNITTYLKNLNIPTVFWNKEDNMHYHIFKKYASLFDHIFTTDKRTIPFYKKECPSAKTIDTLIFAAQPLLHNPIHLNKYEGDVFFAGAWYPFTERMMELEELLDQPNSIKLDIYERGCKNNKSKFPKKFRYRIRNEINYIEMSKKYKSYPIMLNVNSVKGSSTMFSRRVPEALLCGISVISSPSVSIKLLFPHVFLKDKKEDVYKIIKYLLENSEYRYEHNHLCKRHILLHHIYLNRMVQICKIINIKPPIFKTNVVSIRFLSNNEKHNEILLDDLSKQTYQHIPIEMSIENVKNIFYHRKLPDGTINEMIGFVCLFYPKSRYEPNYILDSILSYQYFESIDIIGKASINTWENNKIKLVHPELENNYTDKVHQHTITMSLAGNLEEREKKLHYLLNLIDDKYNSDTLKIYSSDKYNFIYVK